MAPGMGVQPGSFGELLRWYRELAGLSQVALAARSGISEDAISMLERGVRTSPRNDTVARLAQGLRLDPSHREALLAAARGGLRTPEQRDGRPAGGEDTDNLLAGARALFTSLPTTALPATSSEHADAVTALRAELGEAAFGLEYEAGSRLTPAQAILEVEAVKWGARAAS
jgi:transcriptional regulator with XRE-family HTH domain